MWTWFIVSTLRGDADWLQRLSWLAVSSGSAGWLCAAAQLVRTEEDVEEEEDTTFPSTTSWTTVTTRLVVVLEDLVVTLRTNQNRAQVSVCVAH